MFGCSPATVLNDGILVRAVGGSVEESVALVRVPVVPQLDFGLKSEN